MYKVNTVKFLNNLVVDILKAYVMPNKSKSEKNESILPICDIKKVMIKHFTFYSLTQIHY